MILLYPHFILGDKLLLYLIWHEICEFGRLVCQNRHFVRRIRSKALTRRLVRASLVVKVLLCLCERHILHTFERQRRQAVKSGWYFARYAAKTLKLQFFACSRSPLFCYYCLTFKCQLRSRIVLSHAVAVDTRIKHSCRAEDLGRPALSTGLAKGLPVLPPDLFTFCRFRSTNLNSMNFGLSRKTSNDVAVRRRLGGRGDEKDPSRSRDLLEGRGRGGRAGIAGALHCRARGPVHKPVRLYPLRLLFWRSPFADTSHAYFGRDGPAELMMKVHNNRRIGLMAAQVVLPACSRGKKF